MASAKASSSLTDAALRRRLRARLLAWFHRHQRDLPWRHDRDPYRIWISEVMLQQTQVAAVVPYFQRFLRALPTFADLAAASEQQVLRLWEGLGYYRRALNLHRAARQLLEEYGGRLPDDPEVWRVLPGVGRYILGAVLSQAFDRRLPIVEANSERVLCRLLGLTDDPRRQPARRRLWQAAESLLPVRRVGDFNQALMELGALVCTPANPRCGDCPLAGDCQARRLGRQLEIPRRAASPQSIGVREVAIVVRRAGRVLLVQRPKRGRWAGMWEFPRGPVKSKESCETAASRLLPELTDLHVQLGNELLTVRHSVTHHRITLVCFEAKHQAGRFRSRYYLQGRWVPAEELTVYPVSAPQRRLARALLQSMRQNNCSIK